MVKWCDMKKEIVVLSLVIAVLLSISAVAGVYATNDDSRIAASPAHESQSGALLDPTTIPKYVNQLTGPPPVYVPTTGTVYSVTVSSFDQQILPPPLPKTHVFGYGGLAKDAVTGAPLGFVRTVPGPTFEATRGISINVKWTNAIKEPYMFAVDPTLYWANPNNMPMPREPAAAPPFPPGYYAAQSPVPIVTHLHGGEDQSTSDGHPDAWWTYDGKHGSAYSTYTATDPNSAVFHYPNTQPPTTLWYHDHAHGVTRLNVMAGLSGFYLLRDAADHIAPLLPSGKYEMPLVIQDRDFYANGSLFFPSNGPNPTVHPYWREEFFGNSIMVNGKVWPTMNVDRGVYRFRLLDGSNARYYTFSFSNGMPFTMIGSDGGYLKAPVTLTKLTIAPAERADVLVDFSNVAPGTKIILQNAANAPFPYGDPVNPLTTGQIMQFNVTNNHGRTLVTLPTLLNPTLVGSFPNLPTPTKTRVLTLAEVKGPSSAMAINEAGFERLKGEMAMNDLEYLLDGQDWSAPVSEQPHLGTTEDWVIINLTTHAHPIHLHLVQFQLVSRQAINVTNYKKDWEMKNGEPPFNHSTIAVSPTAYLIGSAAGAPPQEHGWKDTINMNPGEVTIIRVRFAPIDKNRVYSFNAAAGPGYVWHCHMIDHEDNQMMRPYKIVSP